MSLISKSQNQNTKVGKRVRNDIFNSLGHLINSSCFYELQTCSRPNKVQEKTFALSKTLPEVAMSLLEGTPTLNFNNFINSMKITLEKFIALP